MIDDKNKGEFWVAKVDRFWDEMKLLRRQDRWQYTLNTKALLFRGIEKDDELRIKQGQMIENGFFVASRCYLPFCLYRLHKAGLFSEPFTMGEFRYMVRIFIVTRCIELFGHFLMKEYLRPVH